MATNVSDTNGTFWKVAFDTNQGALFAFNSAGVFNRCAIDSTGVSFVEQSPTFYNAGGEFAVDAGSIFTSAGRLVQYSPFHVDWLFTGTDQALLVKPDAASGRVFYLTQSGVNVYEIASRRFLGSIAITNMAGTPSSLVRWGTNGLAFRTSNNQLFVIRSPLVSPAAEADVAIALNGPSGPVGIGTNAVFTVNVTNQGPSQATGLQITNSASSALNFVSVSADGGTWTTNGGVLVWTLPTLAAGGQSSLSYSVTTNRPGVITVLASVTTATFDPNRVNNSAVQSLVCGTPLGLDRSARLNLPANDLVWVPTLGKLLLTTSTNIPNWGGSLISVDPVSMAVQFQSALGSDAGRLALARDQSLLYAGIDSGVAMFSLPTLALTNRFPVNSTYADIFACDMQSPPGKSQVLIVAGKNHSDNSTWVSAYDGGVALTNSDFFYSTGVSLAIGDDPSVAYCKDYSELRRETIDGRGATLFDSNTGLLPPYSLMDLVRGNGRIYTSMGQVIDASNYTLVGTIAGISSRARVLYDTASDRIFFFDGVRLAAFDGPTLLPVGTSPISGVPSVERFVRWGMDGFAATSSSGDLLLFRSSLVATNPPADVAISLTQSAAPYIVKSNIIATILITNAGPNAATDVAWSNALPAATIVNATTSLGSLTISSNALAGVIPSLPVGAAATVNVTFATSATGIMTNQVSVLASSVDPAFANNLVALTFLVQSSAGGPSTLTLTLAVKDLARDPLRPVLYASLGSSAGALADSVVVIDPISGTVSAPVHVGSNPGLLTPSPDGQFLYVALDGAGSVQKLALPSLASVSSFPVVANQTVNRIVVSPASPDVVVIHRSSGPSGRTALYIADVHQPNELTSQDLFAFSENSGQLFGCDGLHSNVKLYRLNAMTNGLSLLDGQPGKQSQSTDLKSSGGLLFFNGGMVVNPDNQRVLATMPVPNNSLVEPDTASGRVFYLTPSGNNWTLRAFDIAQGIEVGAVPLPALASAPVRLMRWGADGLALFDTSQIIILRGQLVPINMPVDVVLKQSLSVSTASTNDALTVSLQVTNLGPVAASSVVVTQTFSLPVTNITLTPSVGNAIFTNGAASWVIGNLDTGTVASLTATLRPVQTGTLAVSANATHSLNDLFWGNNTALGVVNIANSAAATVLQIPFGVRELVYDASRDVLYASTPASNGFQGNLIAEIDPATGELKGTLPAGSQPNQIALADDGSYLHVALDGAMGIRHFDLRSNTPDIFFQFGTNDIYFAQGLEVQPGYPQTVAASLGSYNRAAGYPSDVWIYDSGVARPTSGGPARGLTFASDGACLLGYVSPGSGFAFMRMWPTPAGFRTDTDSGFSTSPGDLKFSNGRLYSGAGEVVDSYAFVKIGSFGVSGPKAIDSEHGRAYFLAQNGSSWQVRAFDLGTLQPVGMQAVSNVQGTPGSLVCCGAGRLAFGTSANQLFLIQSPIVATTPVPSANLAVTQQGSQDFGAAVETLRFTITVTN